MEDYQKYLTGCQQHKATNTITIVKSNGDYKAFGEIAVLAGQLCQKEVRRIDRHRIVYLARPDLATLRKAGYQVEVT